MVSIALILTIDTSVYGCIMQFAPTYHDYVLYNSTNESNDNSDQGEAASTKYRSRTFVPTGQEMDAVRKNKHILSTPSSPSSPSNVNGRPNQNQMVDSSESPTATTMKSSFLKDASTESSRSYDLSLVNTDVNPTKFSAVLDESSKR